MTTKKEEIEVEGQKPKKRTKKKPVNKKPEKMTVEVEEGVGESIAKAAKATGMDKIAQLFTKATGEDCGCDERREQYNKRFILRRKKKVNCLTEEQYTKLKTLLDFGENNPSRKLKQKQAEGIAQIYSEIFGTRYDFWCTACATTWAQKIRELEAVLDVYEKLISE